MLQFRVVKSWFPGEGNVVAHAVKLAKRSGPPVQDREPPSCERLCCPGGASAGRGVVRA